MRIGYPCINTTIGCKSGQTFRLKSYSEDRLIETVENNLVCLSKILSFNLRHNLLFFRVTSDLVPFASHTICMFNWQRHFQKQFKTIGDFIKSNNMRISLHPNQFTLINSVDKRVYENSVRELAYHAEVLDLMKLGTSAKIQIHVGGVYIDKEKSMKRFVKRYESLNEEIKRRLVIENDDGRYGLKDCLRINGETGIPVLFDVLHHEINNSGETIRKAFGLFTRTWKEKDGSPMVDYGSSKDDSLQRRHSRSIDLEHFSNFLEETRAFDFDVMLEVKDKEKSALKAVEIMLRDDRFLRCNP